MIYIDDSIMKKNEKASGGSEILKKFISPINATALERLGEKTEQKGLYEFGMGDPGSLDYIANDDDVLLCNDVFGFVRTRAARENLYYIRPSYGTVSRFGLIPTACSMDQIGIVCKNPKKGFSVLSLIAGHDENDGAMFPDKNYSYSDKSEKQALITKYDDFFGKLEKREAAALNVAEQVFYILAFAEICNNISRYDGIKFGNIDLSYNNLDDLYKKFRSHFAYNTKLAAIMGCALLCGAHYEKYYIKAMKIRRLIKNALAFDSNHVLALPEGGRYLSALSGLPSLAFSHNGNYLELLAQVKQESVLLSVWEALNHEI